MGFGVGLVTLLGSNYLSLFDSIDWLGLLVKWGSCFLFSLLNTIVLLIEKNNNNKGSFLPPNHFFTIITVVL